MEVENLLFVVENGLPRGQAIHFQGVYARRTAHVGLLRTRGVAPRARAAAPRCTSGWDVRWANRPAPWPRAAHMGEEYSNSVHLLIWFEMRARNLPARGVLV